MVRFPALLTLEDAMGGGSSRHNLGAGGGKVRQGEGRSLGDIFARLGVERKTNVAEGKKERNLEEQNQSTNFG